MSYLGSWKIDDLLTFPALTTRFDTGAATDADSVATYRVYEDETSTPILTGSMALLDGSNTAGFYSEQITLSAANGFEKGKCYSIYIAATVNSVAGATYHTFQMEAEVDANRVNWANVDNPTTTVGLSGTTVKTATDVETDTQDLQARLPAALVSGRIDAALGAVQSGVVLGVKKNTAFTAMPFVMIDSSTHQPVTGKSPAVTRSIDGGAFGAGGLTNVVEVGNGAYALDGIAGDLNGTYILMRATDTGCDASLWVIVTTA